MDRKFQAIVTAAVTNAKRQRSLLWAEMLARRIADASPMPVDEAALAERITEQAVLAGVAVKLAGTSARSEPDLSEIC